MKQGLGENHTELATESELLLWWWDERGLMKSLSVCKQWSRGWGQEGTLLRDTGEVSMNTGREISNNCYYLHTQAPTLLTVCCSTHPVFLCHIFWIKPMSCFRSGRELWVLGSKELLCLQPLSLCLCSFILGISSAQCPIPAEWSSRLNPISMLPHGLITFFIPIKKHATIYLTNEAWCMAACFWTFGQA